MPVSSSRGDSGEARGSNHSFGAETCSRQTTHPCHHRQRPSRNAFMQLQWRSLSYQAMPGPTHTVTQFDQQPGHQAVRIAQRNNKKKHGAPAWPSVTLGGLLSCLGCLVTLFYASVFLNAHACIESSRCVLCTFFLRHCVVGGAFPFSLLSCFFWVGLFSSCGRPLGAQVGVLV
jgi:hypothetical protein